MFRSLFLSLLAALPVFMQAQSFTLEYDSLFKDGAPRDVSYEMVTKLQTSSSSNVNLRWEMIGNTLPSSWFYSVCDNSNCYFEIKDKATFDFAPFNQSGYGFFKVSINPKMTNGCGTITLHVYDKDKPEIGDTVTFTFCTWATGIEKKTSETLQLDIFPNPASNVLTISSNKVINEDTKVLIFNLLGQEQKDVQIIKRRNYIDVNLENLRNGTYLMQYVTPSGSVTTKRFTKRA